MRVRVFMKDHEPFVSVVVPVYNVERYLDQCVESILGQSYKNFELILVDDGSPDHCGVMCDRYAASDSRIVVLHKQNGGLSDARNTGIQAARGQYITFIDSDDYIDRDYLQYLMNAALDTGANIVQAQMTRTECELGQTKNDPGIYDSREAFSRLMTWNNVEVYAWGKLYRIELFREIRYPVGRINEDCCTTYKLILRSEKVAIIDNIVYYYRITPNSILNSDFNMARFLLWDVPKEIAEYIGHDKTCYDELEYYKIRIGINLLNESAGAKENIDIQNKRVEISKWLCKANKNNKYLTKKYKLLMLLAGRSLRIFSAISRMRSFTCLSKTK